jgi:type IV pilus assembly protein PilX
MNAMNPCSRSSIDVQAQRGIVLVMVLMFLVVLTLLGMAAMRGTLLEERMAGNSRDRDLAFQSSEAALRAGEAVLAGAVLPAMAAGTANTPRIAEGTQTAYWQATHDWDGESTSLPAVPDGTAEAPRYVIEELSVTAASGGGGLGVGALGDEGVYRVTARGVGSNPNTVVILQAIYQR